MNCSLILSRRCLMGLLLAVLSAATVSLCQERAAGPARAVR
jgi:hypothetical protein